MITLGEYLRLNAFYIVLNYFDSIKDNGYAFSEYKHMWE